MSDAPPISTNDATRPTLDDAREVLRRHWGYADFRPGQDQAVANVLAGGDSLTTMPTGGGKSLCYQVPAMLLPGVTLVVSPLISLMKDQVDGLEKAGVPATFVNSSLSGSEMTARLDAAARGEFKLVYVAPERFDAEGFRQRLGGIRVSLLAVDEAHCVSEWGHDFRPSYLRLSAARRVLGDPPVAALTATATEEVRRDIVRQLKLADPSVLVTGFDRRNLVWHVLPAKNDSEKDRMLLKLLRGRDGSSIVYASTRKNVDALSALLNGSGVAAVGYHAGLPDLERKRIQDRFMRGDVRVVVATNAFGMGIDKSDVRIVVHYNMPGNLEAYYQEAGRAGRDGGPSDCVLLHAYADRFTHQFFIAQANPPREAVAGMLKVLRRGADASGVCTVSVAELARAADGVDGDRQGASAVRVLEQFGVVKQSRAGTPTVRLRLVAAPKRISAELGERPEMLEFMRALWKLGGGEGVYRGAEVEWRHLARAAGGRHEAAAMLDALREEGFLEWQPSGEGVWVLDRDTPFGQLPIDWRALEEKRRRDERKLDKMQIYAYTRDCRRGYVLEYFGDVAAMKFCGACDNCLRESGEGLAERFGIRLDEPSPARERAPRMTKEERRERRAGRREEAAPLPAGNAALADSLRRLRRELAKKHDLPAFMIFSDQVLEAMARAAPTSPEGLLRISGVGPKTLERFGAPLLAVLREHAGMAADGGGLGGSLDSRGSGGGGGRANGGGSGDRGDAGRHAPEPAAASSADGAPFSDGGPAFIPFDEEPAYGGDDFSMTADPAPAARRASSAGVRPAGALEDVEPPTPEQAELYGRLKTLRNELAKAANLPAYCVFADKTLIELARRRPASEAEMRVISGVGPAKLEKYGEAFLQAIREA
jgi:ATP-dependent DNA helicase RecQ